MPGKRRPGPLAPRFWGYVHRCGPDDCWPWLGRLFDGQRYGQFALDGRPARAHRVAWMLTRGPIPDGLYVCHSCDNPACCNPSHLWLGTHDDNMADRQAKGRTLRGADHPLRRHPEFAAHPKGEANARAKVTADDVRAIRLAFASGERQRSIANRYGINIPSVSMIVNRKNWSHID